MDQFKVSIEFFTVVLLLHVLVFLAVWHLGSYFPGQELNLNSALEGKVLTNGLPEKSFP